MSVSQSVVPSLLLPEVYGPWKDEPGFFVKAIERAAREGFYRSVELCPVILAEDRASIRDICSEHEIDVSVWLTQLLDQESLDLTAIDEGLRSRSVEGTKRAMAEAVECGARTVAFIGGADPGPDLRERGFDSFVKSMKEVSAEAKNLGADVMFEPLDRFAHKKRLVGPTSEILPAFRRVREEFPTFGVAFDTAHAALNEEDILQSLEMAGQLIANMHLSNAVLDKADPLYGDHHILPGAPGFLTVDTAAAIIAKLVSLGITGRRVAIETRAPRTDNPEETASLAEAFLKDALKRADTIGGQQA